MSAHQTLGSCVNYTGKHERYREPLLGGLDVKILEFNNTQSFEQEDSGCTERRLHGKHETGHVKIFAGHDILHIRGVKR